MSPSTAPTSSRCDEPLELAAHRGVEVRVIVPARSDKSWVDAASRTHFERLLEAGVHVHLHRALLHAKSISIDDALAWRTTVDALANLTSPLL